MGTVGRSLGISPGAVIPVGTLLLLIPAVLVAANVLALWPIRRSATVRAAVLLLDQ